ncbi:S41 family peptidase [Niabella aurantiaca]|uniref:S41 family peptidase n=1 Tax=Niabella aurantiaca TaxID=379900 RepID=UPI00037E9B5F|nr:S41 family peptidase [Niabella aurantiaca]
MRPVIINIILFFTVVTCYAQVDTSPSFDFNRKYSVPELKKDLAILKDSLEIIHPALYRYINKASFDQAFKNADKFIDRPLTQTAFYTIVAPLVSKVGDIHTTIELPEESHSYLATESKLFPFDVRIVDKKVYIASNNSADSSIRAGSRILKINNQPVDEVLRKMQSCFSDEGANETLKLKRVEQRFAFQYHLNYGYSKAFKVEYTFNNKPSQTKTVRAEPFSVIKTRRGENQQKFPHLKSLFPQAPYLALSIDAPKNIAILTIKWFQNDVLREANEQFRPFIDSAFAEIKERKINNLIIDIRNNGGGESENASYLYAYLTNKPFRFLYAMEANQKTYDEDRERGVKYTFVKNTGKYHTSDSTTPYQQFFGLGYQSYKPNSFSGKLYVLIDGLTTSAAPQFASLVKQNRRGILIGENAPGSLSGGSGRGYSYFLLPNSGLLTMISRYRLYLVSPAQKTKDRCVTPDYRPAKSFNDLLGGVIKTLNLL